MPKASQELITELKKNKRFMGTCPNCNEEFRLSDAALFAIDAEPPEDALAAIEAVRQRIRERKEELANDRERMTKRAQNTAHAVNLGKIVEKIVPSFSSFTYDPGDCRALFEPIDYLIFSGLRSSGMVDALLFVDVKSGNARLTEGQKSIKQVVESGKIKFVTTVP